MGNILTDNALENHVAICYENIESKNFDGSLAEYQIISLGQNFALYSILLDDSKKFSILKRGNRDRR